MEILVAHYSDGDLGSLDGYEEFITPAFPSNLQRSVSGEFHLLARSAVFPFGYLHTPENSLVSGAHLGVVF